METDGGEMPDVSTDEVRQNAHELRNPLASIIGCARTLLDGMDRLDDGTRRSFLEVIVTQAEHLDWLICALAECAEEEEGRPGELDALEVARVAAGSVGVHLDTGDAPMGVLADERRLRLGMTGLFAGLRPADPNAVIVTDRRGGAITIGVPEVNLDERRIAAKLALARALLEREGCRVDIATVDGVTEARLTMPPEERAS